MNQISKVSAAPWLESHACASGDCEHRASSQCLDKFTRDAIDREEELCKEVARLSIGGES